MRDDYRYQVVRVSPFSRVTHAANAKAIQRDKHPQLTLCARYLLPASLFHVPGDVTCPRCLRRVVEAQLKREE